ncbi:MAG TPA: AmmeMemoRadiSam system protein A [Exilispira sp.]|nr:AmmeMemoRadiSam system protein A [Exilispira sp.]
MELQLDESEKNYYLELARKSIAKELNIPYNMDFDSSYIPPHGNEKYGVFVTLTEKGELRGCIGLVRGVEPLTTGIKTMAKEAAFNDYRFGPLRKNEFNDIKIEISILSPMEKINNINEIVIGRDGLMIVRGTNSGLLLPQVPVEYGWDLKTYLEHLCLKAGLPKNSYTLPGTIIYSFSAYVFNEN